MTVQKGKGPARANCRRRTDSNAKHATRYGFNRSNAGNSIVPGPSLTPSRRLSPGPGGNRQIESAGPGPEQQD
jgi:hypothetical protein